MREARRPRRAVHGAAEPTLQSLFAQIMPLAGIATWKARSNPLELVELNVGGMRASPFTLAPEALVPGASWIKSIHPPDRLRVQRFLRGDQPRRRRRAIDYRLITSDGHLLWVRHWLLTSSPARGGRRNLEGFLMAIPEQKQLEMECLHTSERECQRIGRELHDDLGQVLTGITCLTQSLSRQVANLAPTLAPQFAEMANELKNATTRVRAMAHGLFPVQLDYLTLRHALQEFARQVQTRFAVKFFIQFSGRLAAHSPEQILHVYRILQEAVGNSIRHGHATAVRIFVDASPQLVRLRIEDNGTGFPRGTTGRPEGIGMHIMQYRARMLAGEIRFSNLPRSGAVIALQYPVQPQALTEAHPPLLNENQSLHRR